MLWGDKRRHRLGRKEVTGQGGAAALSLLPQADGIALHISFQEARQEPSQEEAAAQRHVCLHYIMEAGTQVLPRFRHASWNLTASPHSSDDGCVTSGRLLKHLSGELLCWGACAAAVAIAVGCGDPLMPPVEAGVTPCCPLPPQWQSTARAICSTHLLSYPAAAFT